MTSGIKESTDFLDPALLVTLRDKEYRIEPLSAETVVILQNARDAVTQAQQEGKTPEEMSKIEVEGTNGEDRETQERRIFGPAYDEMLADNVSHIVRFRLSQIIMIWTFSGFELAEAYVMSQGKDLTVPRNRAERRAKPRTATKTSTGVASTTRKPGSASGTSTRKAAPKPAAGSGKTSSDTGTPSKPTSKTSA